MTDDQTGMPGGSESGEAPDPGSGQPKMPSMESMAEQATQMFSSSEGMVAAGGGIWLLCYLIFDLIFDQFSVGTLELLAALLVVLLPRLNRAFVEKFAPLPALMRAGGYGIAFLAVVEILYLFDLGEFYDGWSILGAAFYFVGAAIAWLGARSINA